MPSITAMSSLIPNEAQQLIIDSSSKAPNRAPFEVEPALRELSPLFLKEIPFDPDDSLIDKCLKSIRAVLGLFHYARPEVRSLLEFQPIASQLQSIIQPKLDEIGKEMNQIYFSFLDSMFCFEYYKAKLQVVKGVKLEVRKGDLLDLFLGSFEEVLKARSSVYIDGKKVSLKDKDTRAVLLDQRKKHLLDLFEKLQKVSGNTIADVEMGVEVFENMHLTQHALNVELNYALVEIKEALEYPLLTLS